MAIELITCSACRTKNASHRKVCLSCGASISTSIETKTRKGLSFSKRVRQWVISFIEKRNENSKADNYRVILERPVLRARPLGSEADKYRVAGRSILSAGSALLYGLKDHLEDREIKREWVLLFNAEVACYVLHMLDRTLAMPAFVSSRARIMDSLVVTLDDAISFMLKEIGYTQVREEELTKGIDAETFVARMDEQIKQVALATGQQAPVKSGEQMPSFLALVVNGFIEMCNERQQEYGALKKESWFGDVALRFGKHAGEALELDEARIVVHCALVAPDVFKELFSSLSSLADIDP